MRIYFLALAVSQEGKMILRRRVVKNKAVYFTARLTLRGTRGVSPLGPDVKILTNQNYNKKIEFTYQSRKPPNFKVVL